MSAAKRTAILISGRGSNMASLVEAAGRTDYPAEIVGVFCNRADAAGLDHARAAGLPTEVRPHRDYPSREAFDAAIGEVFDTWGAEIVCLAGFMRMFSAGFAERWAGRMLNVHPSLLPAFPGLEPQRQALAAGVTITGATVHFVTPEIDAGPAVIQAAVPVAVTDTPETLAARILAAEHAIYPKALEWLAAGRVRLENGTVVRDPALAAEPFPPAVWPPLQG